MNLYPQLSINLEQIKSNCRLVQKKCEGLGVSVTGVIKGCNGLMPVVRALNESGLDKFGSSRMSHLKEIAASIPGSERWLLRIPMLSEVESVIKYATISLQSERAVLSALETQAKALNIRHEVILMQDLGDLREGVWGQEALVSLALFVEKDCEYLQLAGIGTNLGCYGAIKPNLENMHALVASAQEVEAVIGRPLKYVSGGATSTYPMVLDGTLPKGINHLRIGEGILLSRDLKTFYGLERVLNDMWVSTFTLKAQIIEIKEKPSHPVGEIFVDAFGNQPEYEDKGVRRRALLAAGKQDFGDHEKLLPVMEGVQVVGSSSDHLIVDITDLNEGKRLEVGDILEFELFYQAMLYLAIDKDVIKVYHT